MAGAVGRRGGGGKSCGRGLEEDGCGQWACGVGHSGVGGWGANTGVRVKEKMKIDGLGWRLGQVAEMTKFIFFSQSLCDSYYKLCKIIEVLID